MIGFAERALRVACFALTLASCRKEPPASPAPVPLPPAAAEPAPPPVDRSASLATVVCEGSGGRGFFIAPDRLVTRASFVCDSPKVRLADGRTLMAKLRGAQRDPDVAELEVIGGEGAALPIGDAFTVHDADEVTIPSGPRGTVRTAVRTHLGVPHFEVAFDRVAAEGSPVLDSEGRVIGVLAGDALALPIEALEHGAAWARLEQRARPIVADEVRQLKRALGAPGLASAVVDPSGRLRVVLLSRATSFREVTLQLNGCTPTVPVAWEPFRVNAWYDARARALMQFIDKNDLDIALSMSIVEVPLDGCTGIEVALEGAEPLLHHSTITRTPQTMSSTREAPTAPATAGAARPASPVDKGPNEHAWRGRFQSLAADRERFESDLRAKQQFIENADANVRRANAGAGALMVLSPDERERYDQYKRDLETADTDRAALARRADDLEREASNAAVPREWRR